MKEISDKGEAIIIQTRKLLLLQKDQLQEKKSWNTDFDVVIGRYDGAKMYEIVGIYTLHKISNMMDKIDLGLYRDDGLGIFNNLSGPKLNGKRNK